MRISTGPDYNVAAYYCRPEGTAAAKSLEEMKRSNIDSYNDSRKLNQVCLYISGYHFS